MITRIESRAAFLLTGASSASAANVPYGGYTAKDSPVALQVSANGKKVALDRYTLRIRNNSAYAAWADADGMMIKLVPLPYKADAKNWLVREGYEKSAAGLRPPN